MSSWYVFSALGFYPVNPVSGTYVVGRHAFIALLVFSSSADFEPCSPFFDKITFTLPASSRALTIIATGASTSKPYVCSLTVNGRAISSPIIQHEDIANGGEVVFEMSSEPCVWGSATLSGSEVSRLEKELVVQS